MLYKDETYDFGVLLKELREKKGMTQEQLAKKLGVSKGSVSGYEHNISMPPVSYTHLRPKHCGCFRKEWSRK